MSFKTTLWDGVALITYDTFGGAVEDLFSSKYPLFARSTSIDSDEAKNIKSGDVTAFPLAGTSSDMLFVFAITSVTGKARVNVKFIDTGGTYELNLLLFKNVGFFAVLVEDDVDDLEIIFEEYSPGDIFTVNVEHQTDGVGASRLTGES